MSFIQYVQENYPQILGLLVDHIRLTAISVGLAILIGVPLGIIIAYAKKISKPVLAVANVIQAIPSMALLGFLIPLLGIGSVPAVVAVVLYSLLPIIKNTYTGIENINAETLEAAKGIGLTPFQVLTKVQIPLALPIIMAGVRVASVTAVGLMTMASFIGADGLGFLVFSGIRTVNNNQILGGAIPACLLALFVDFLFGTVEKLVTPVSLQKGSSENKKKQRNRQRTILGATAAAIAAVMVFAAVSNSSGDSRTITVAGKDFTEQGIVVNMIADVIEENTDIEVNRKVDLGGTQICFEAIKNGDIDMYVEYTGTAYGDFFKHPGISDMDKVYQTVKTEFKDKYNIEVLKQMKFNNTFVLGVSQETADKYGLESISDLKNAAGQMKAGMTYEFVNRDDGLEGLQEKYGFQFGDVLTFDGAPRYTALSNKEVDVIDAYATDGLIKKFSLKVLKDDQNYFPPYYAIPIIRSEALREYPEIVPLLEELGEHLTDEVMTDLNYQVDQLQRTPREVAKEFLQSEGLISK
ncbi:glycine betaine ABC transporter substrate-binding protein [Muricomes intestini]|jgi:osmoprotectant transport system permease protein|uniref:ABC transporter permease/substrate-binding protein n=1 Tax=Muricomes intestini TaxID=1796634 RepID=UPI002FDE538B